MNMDLKQIILRTMNNYILAFLVLFCSSCSMAQCPSGDLVLETQAEIDAFAANYPNCDHFPGNIYIKEDKPGNIKNLVGLSSLKSIDGYLYIERNVDLRNLIGLHNLETIYGALHIGYNQSLKSINGLDKLSTIGDFLDVWSNPSLESLDGLDNLFYVDGSLYIGFNTRLSTLIGLDRLSYVGGHLDIGNNPSLTSLCNLAELKQIEGCINIDNNPSLTSLSGLENIDPSSITDLEIIRSGQLSHCTISSICDYLRLGGSAVFMDNAEGCNSFDEVFLECSLFPEEIFQPGIQSINK